MSSRMFTAISITFILKTEESKYTRLSKCHPLPKVVDDGPMMEKILNGYKIHSFSNVNDIRDKIVTVQDDLKDTKIGRLHFHFSGHGSNNRKIEASTENPVAESKTSDGECLVGIKGDEHLYSVHDLKHELLKFNSTTITITLDCCRIERRGNNTSTKSPEKVQTVLLNHLEPILYEDQLKIAVLYAALDLHSVHDSKSLTKELANVTKEWKNPIPITKIASKVNVKWTTIKQGCKDDFFEVGNNWADFYWPNFPKEKMNEDDSNQSQEENSNQNQETTPTPPWAQELIRGGKRVNKTVKGINKKITTIEKDVSNLKEMTHKITTIEEEINNLKSDPENKNGRKRKLEEENEKLSAKSRRRNSFEEC